MQSFGAVQIFKFQIETFIVLGFWRLVESCHWKNVYSYTHGSKEIQKNRFRLLEDIL